MNGIIVSPTTEPLGGLLQGYDSVYVIYDVNVQMFAYMEVIPRIPAGHFKAKMALSLGEEHKTLDTVGLICRWLLQQGASRQSLVIAVGGGITTDIVGFAASVYERGIKCAYVPTTLLAQVDAAIGGKTGVNLDSYKNMVGTFTMPLFTLISSRPLQQLSRREFLNGAAEVIKSFIIEDNGWYEKAIAYLTSYSQGRTTAAAAELTPIIEAAVAVKAGIVERDFKESGERRKLNLGHTFAHAIEHLSQQEAATNKSKAVIPHGEAVAMGMVLAAELSERLSIAPKGLAAKIKADIKACGLPVDCPYPVEKLKEAMSHDKKAQGDAVNFVLIAGIGDTVVEKIEIASL